MRRIMEMVRKQKKGREIVYKRGIKIVFVAIIMILCICTLGAVSTKKGEKEKKEGIDKTAEEIEAEEDFEWLLEEVDGDLADLQLDYKITEQWEDYYYVEITLTNITDEEVEDWQFNLPANYEIKHICDVEIKDFHENIYTLKNTEKNHDIPQNGIVSFGMLVKAKEEPRFPTYVDSNMFRDEVDQEKYKMSLTVLHKWGNVVNGKITITNKTYHIIEDWSVECEANLKMEQIWDAVIKGESEDEENENKDISYYNLYHPENNQNIGPKKSVEIGFIAKCSGTPKISSFRLYEMSPDLEEDEDEEEDDDEKLEFVDEFILDSDYFETREEYEEYLEEHGYEDDALLEK